MDLIAGLVQGLIKDEIQVAVMNNKKERGKENEGNSKDTIWLHRCSRLQDWGYKLNSIINLMIPNHFFFKKEY